MVLSIYKFGLSFKQKMEEAFFFSFCCCKFAEQTSLPVLGR